MILNVFYAIQLALIAHPALSQVQIKHTFIAQHVYLPVLMARFHPLLLTPALHVTLNASSAIQQAPIVLHAPFLVVTKLIFIT